MKVFRILILPLLFTAIGANAQSSTPSVVLGAPLATPSASPKVQPHDRHWAQMEKYFNYDTKLGAPASGETRVVFFGDSITESWRGDAFFPGKTYINRGISGQTTTQMLMRFPQDVIALHPAVVTILAGTNDIAQNQGPITLEEIEKNLEALVALARENGICPIVCSVLPAKDFWWRRGLQPAEKIRQLNRMIEAYCSRAHVSYVNYYPAMVDAEHGMRKEYSGDGVHPNSAGYAVMSRMAQAAINRALGIR